MYKSFLFKEPLLFFKSFKDTPVIYERKAGYNGSEHGDINDKNPAPKARNKFSCTKTIPPKC